MKKRTFWLKGAAFACVLVLCLLAAGLVLAPKYKLKDLWPTTTVFTDFYQLEEGSVDVLFMGSSHAVSAFDPMVLYASWGMTAYTLASEQQSLPVTWFWLNEALKTQQPQALVLDTYFLFPYYDMTSPLNTTEVSLHKAFDFMRPSLLRTQAVWELCRLDQDLAFFDLLMPAVRYHNRVSSLTQDDFDLGLLSAPQELLGYAPSFQENAVTLTGYEPLYTDESTEPDPIHPVMLEYLDRITALCESRGITLMLVKTPSVLQTEAQSRAVQLYAEEHGLMFVDFNHSDVYYSELAYDFLYDNGDGEHANAWGAQKLTEHTGMLLESELGVEGRGEHPFWEQTRERYEAWLEAMEE